MKDFNYIREHPEEYKEEYETAKRNMLAEFEKLDMPIADGIDIGKACDIAFHLDLIRFGKESKPEKCMGCPMFSTYFLPSGQIGTRCEINTDWYVGDLFFGWNEEKRPHWCPLDKDGK